MAGTQWWSWAPAPLLVVNFVPDWFYPSSSTRSRAAAGCGCPCGLAGTRMVVTSVGSMAALFTFLLVGKVVLLSSVYSLRSRFLGSIPSLWARFWSNLIPSLNAECTVLNKFCKNISNNMVSLAFSGNSNPSKVVVVSLKKCSQKTPFCIPPHNRYHHQWNPSLGCGS